MVPLPVAQADDSGLSASVATLVPDARRATALRDPRGEDCHADLWLSGHIRHGPAGWTATSTAAGLPRQHITW
jgi:hypothetical protein